MAQPTVSPGAPRVPLPPTALPRHTVDLHGSQVAFVDAGEGDPVVLLHGITCSAASWNGIMERLASHHRVIVPDLPGHGWSSRARGDYSMAGFALHVRDLLLGLGIRRATFVGHSLGGGVTMQTAYAYPELVGRMVLIASGGLGETVGLPLRLATLPGVEWLMPVTFNRYGAGVTRWLASRLPRRRATSPRESSTVPAAPRHRRLTTLHELANSYATLADPAARKAFVSLIRGVIDWSGQRIDATARLHLAEDIPTMVVWGDSDLIIPIGHGHRAARGTVVDRFEVFEGAGHFPQLEQPDRFVALLEEFLHSTEPAATGHAELAESIRDELRRSDASVRTPERPVEVA